MNYRMIGRLLSQLVLLEAVCLIPAAAISLGFREWDGLTAIAISMGIMLAVSGILWHFCKKAKKSIGATEGMVTTSLAWILLSLLGCLPLFISGYIPRYIDALFEIVSGFTTTGSSIMPDVEILPHGLMYWRCFTHWLGGMGVLVLLLAIAPAGGKGQGFTMHLLRAESPGPDVGKLVPKMKKTAAILYCIYIAMTLLNVAALLLGGMYWLDALCIAFGTAGTGGFGILNSSMASYSPYIQIVTTVFLVLFGINFSCWYLLLLRQFRAVFRDEELRLYLGLFFGVALLIAVTIRPLYGTLGEAVRHSFFQVATIMTTAGFATTDFDLWPMFAKGLLLLLMVVGACAGSTGGGLKCARVLLLFKSLGRNIRRVTNSNRVDVVRINGKTVNETVVDNTNAYFAAYVIIIVVSFLLLCLDGQTVGTNFTAVLACFNNIGPGLEAVGPTCNFSFYSDLSKLALIFDRLAGRLEIFPMLILFSKLTWKR